MVKNITLAPSLVTIDSDLLAPSLVTIDAPVEMYFGLCEGFPEAKVTRLRNRRFFVDLRF